MPRKNTKNKHGEYWSTEHLALSRNRTGSPGKGYKPKVKPAKAYPCSMQVAKIVFSLFLFSSEKIFIPHTKQGALQGSWTHAAHISFQGWIPSEHFAGRKRTQNSPLYQEVIQKEVYQILSGQRKRHQHRSPILTCCPTQHRFLHQCPTARWIHSPRPVSHSGRTSPAEEDLNVHTTLYPTLNS